MAVQKNIHTFSGIIMPVKIGRPAIMKMPDGKIVRTSDVVSYQITDREIEIETRNSIYRFITSNTLQFLQTVLMSL